MLTTHHPVDFAYTRPELAALFRYARAHDVEQGGRDDARAAAIIVWSQHWLNEATREEPEIIGSFYGRWTDPPALWAIDPDEDFDLEDLVPALGRLELDALGYVKHGDVPREDA
jgi:hypothetical protein